MMQLLRNIRKLVCSFIIIKCSLEGYLIIHFGSLTGVCFKTVKSYSQCREAYLKAANCYKQTGSYPSYDGLPNLLSVF